MQQCIKIQQKATVYQKSNKMQQCIKNPTKCNNVSKIQQNATVYQKSNKVQQCIKNPTKYNSVSKRVISHLHEAQQASDDTLPIIRTLKLH
jgi:hypothetical protein